jgi:hypothetical protein
LYSGFDLYVAQNNSTFCVFKFGVPPELPIMVGRLGSKPPCARALNPNKRIEKLVKKEARNAANCNE